MNCVDCEYYDGKYCLFHEDPIKIYHPETGYCENEEEIRWGKIYEMKQEEARKRRKNERT